MKIWKIADHELTITLMPEWKQDKEKFTESVIGNSIAQEWTPVKLFTSEKGKFDDFPSFWPHIPVFSAKVKEVVGPFLKDQAEMLPVIHPKAEYFVANVMNVIDAVDYSRSIIEKSLSGKFIGFKKLYFNEEVLTRQPHDLFKVPELVRTHVFVSKQFVDLVTKSNLRGYKFREVWDATITQEVENATREKFNQLIAELDRLNGKPYSWDDAVRLVHEGRAVRSGIWKIQVDKKGNLLLARLTPDCEYSWQDPYYIPPILLYSTWYETELSEI